MRCKFELRGGPWLREQPLFWEHKDSSGVRIGQFKLVRQHGKAWELFDMERDRTEMHSLAGTAGKLETDLFRRHEDWAKKAGVLNWLVALPRLLAAWDMEAAKG